MKKKNPTIAEQKESLSNPIQLLFEAIEQRHSWAKEAFEDAKADFKEKIETNPAHEIKWASEDIMRKQQTFVNYDRMLMFMNGNLDKTLEEHCNYIYGHAESLLRSCINESVCNSTGLAHNLETLMNREANRNVSKELFWILSTTSTDAVIGMKLTALKPLFY